ncbi:MAG: DUF5665 domain-containing protein [bacterium]|nr:DUF5665 domain-containing protein [bacterium]
MKQRKDDSNDRLAASEYLPYKTIFLKNLTGGIAWGFGSIIGASVVLSVVIWVLRQIDFIPVLGAYITQIIQAVEPKAQ